jgi:hypothetical protein
MKAISVLPTYLTTPTRPIPPQRMLDELQGVAPGVSAHDMIEERMRISATAEVWVDAPSEGADNADPAYGLGGGAGEGVHSEGAGRREACRARHSGAGSPLQLRPPAGSAVAVLPGASEGPHSEGVSRRESYGAKLNRAGSPLQQRPPAGSAVAAVPFVSRAGSRKWSANKGAGSGGGGAVACGGSRPHTGSADGSAHSSSSDGAAGRGSNGSNGRMRGDSPSSQTPGSGTCGGSRPHSGSADGSVHNIRDGSSGRDSSRDAAAASADRSSSDRAAGRDSNGRMRRDAPSDHASGARTSAQPRPSASLPHCGSAGSFRTSALPLCKALHSPAAAAGDTHWSGQTANTSVGTGVLPRPRSASSCSAGVSGLQASRPPLSAAGGAQALGVSARELADRRMASELAGSRRVLSASSRWHARSR